MKKLLILLAVFSVGSFSLFYQAEAGQGRYRYHQNDPEQLFDRINNLTVSQDIKNTLTDLVNTVRSLPAGSSAKETGRVHIHAAIDHAERGDLAGANDEIRMASDILK